MEKDGKGTQGLGLFLALAMSEQPVFDNCSVNQHSDSFPSRWPKQVAIYEVGTIKNPRSPHCLHASWDGGGLAWLSYVSFKGAINSKVNQAGLLLKRNNVNNPRAPGDVLAPTVGKHPSFCLGLNGKLHV